MHLQPEHSCGRPRSLRDSTHDATGWLLLAVVRVAPRAVDMVAMLRSDHLHHALKETYLAAKALTDGRERASAELHAVIGGCDDKRLRRDLVEARRRLYNGHALGNAHSRALRALTQTAVQEALASLAVAGSRYEGALVLYERAFMSQQEAERDMLRAAANDERLAKGLALASPMLFKALLDASVRPRGARGGQRERGLLRYLTRMVMKATPFATFCHILPVDIVDSVREQRAYLTGDVLQSITVPRLDKHIYGVLWTALRARAAVRAVLRVRLAQTLERDMDAYTALAAVNRREVFQRVHATPLLEVTVGMLRQQGELVMNDLVSAIAEDGRVEAGADEIRTYVERLIELGLLQLCAVVDEREAEWDLPLRRLLATVDDATTQTVARSLGSLREALNMYSAADAVRRAELLAIMRAVVDEMFIVLGIARDDTTGVLFEDASAAATCVLPTGPAMNAVIQTAAELGNLLSRLAPRRVESATMRCFWEKQYRDRESVPLLEFYQDYYRVSKKQRLANERAPEGAADAIDPYRLAFVAQLRHAVKSIRELVRVAWRADPLAEELAIELSALREAMTHVPPSGGATRSLAYFGQVAWDKCHPRIVTRGWDVRAGHGKYISRFLHVLPESVLDEVRGRNSDIGSPLYAEVLGDANFNGNLHPALLRGAIAYPTSDTRVPSSAIACQQLEVLPDREDPNALQVRDSRTGRVVVPVDLGFLTTRGRPPLYQLLVALGNAPDASLELPESFISPIVDVDRDNSHDDKTQLREGSVSTPAVITYRPRIVLGGAVVVSRRKWRIPAQSLPQRFHREEDGSFFLRLNEWRTSAGMPIEGYASVQAIRTQSVDKTPESVDNADPRRPWVISKDAAKPQYVHFGSPALAALFEKLGGGLADFLLDFVERYPSDEDLLRSESGTHSYEFLFQFDRAQTATTLGDEFEALES